MYLKNFTTEQTADRAVIRCSWRDRFHKPIGLRVEKGDEVQGDIVMDGDVKDVHGVLFGLANIAWSLGWRPKGLIASIMNLLTTFKPAPPGPQGQ